MTGKSHQVIGQISGLSVFLVLAPDTYQAATLAAVLVLSGIAALLPDIDQPSASIWKKLPMGHAVGELVNPLLQHRNLTHSLLGFGLIGWGLHSLLALAPAYWGLNQHVLLYSFMAAYGSHILADMVTVQGVPLLFPNQRMFGIPPWPFQGVRIETGGWFENLIVFPLADLTLIGLIVWQWPRLMAALFT